MNYSKRGLCSAVFAFTLLLASCGEGTISPLIQALNIVSITAAAAPATLSLMASQGLIQTNDVLLGTAYADAVNVAIPKVTAELGSADTNVQKIEKIVGLLQPVLRIGLSQESQASPTAKAIIAGITGALEAFLARLGSPQVAVAARRAAHVPLQLALTKADKKILREIDVRTATVNLPCCTTPIP